MGKSSKKAAAKADVVVPVAVQEKPLKKGKREAEEVIEKEVSKKKQKKDVVAKAVEVKKVDVKTVKKVVKKQESSSDESSSDSEDEKKVVNGKVAGATKIAPVPAPKKKTESSDESDSEEDSSDSEEDVVVGKKVPAVAVIKNGSAPVKVKEDTDSEDDSSEEDVPAAKKVPAEKAKNVPVKMEEDSSDDSEDSSSDDEAPAKTVPATQSKNVPVKMEEDSSDDSEDSSSDDEAPPKKVPAAVAKTTPVAAKKKDDSSDEDDSSEEDVPAAKNGPAKTTPVADKKKDDSSEEDDSSDEDVKPSVKAVAKDSSSDDSSEEDSDDEPAKLPAVVKKAEIKASSDDSSSEEEESSEEDEKEQSIKTPKKKEDELPAKANPANLGLSSEKKEVKTPAPKSSGSKTLFMGNLSFSIEKEAVEEFFKDCGEVVDVRFAQYPEGGFKGYGHVEFATAEAAQKGLEKNGEDLVGRPVRLDVAAERPERGAFTPQNRDSSQKSFGSSEAKTIFVRGFDKYADEYEIKDTLREHFSSCGEVTRISVPKGDEGLKGIAYIDFTTRDALDKALALDQSELNEYPINVEEAKPRGDSSGGPRFNSFGSDRGGRRGGRSNGGRDFGGRSSGGRGGRGRDSGGRSGGGRFGGRSGTFATGKKTTFDD